MIEVLHEEIKKLKNEREEKDLTFNHLLKEMEKIKVMMLNNI